MSLPSQYSWLSNEPGPRLLTEFIKVYGTLETKGPGSNPSILRWAKDIGLEDIYKSDDIPWCGLAMAYVAAQAGWEHAPRGNALAARNWLAWGNPVALGQEMLGDVLVYVRNGGGHVGVYVGEDDSHFHTLGGNQGDMVSIKRMPKERFIAARRCPWRVNQPSNVRKIFLAASGEVSDGEA